LNSGATAEKFTTNAVILLARRICFSSPTRKWQLRPLGTVRITDVPVRFKNQKQSYGQNTEFQKADKESAEEEEGRQEIRSSDSRLQR
jgi:hypothetical protein